jgi:serine/threonine protein kinase
MSVIASNITELSNIAGRIEQLLESDNPDHGSHASSEVRVAPISLLQFTSVVVSYGLEQYWTDLFIEGLQLSGWEGADYTVDVCKQSSDNKLVVVKHVKVRLPLIGSVINQDVELSRRLRKALKEVSIMQMSGIEACENILNILGFGWEFAGDSLTSPFLVVEHAEHGTLRDYLRASRPGWDEKHSLSEGVAKGLRALHSYAIIHGDIKMENVLVFKGPADSCIAKLSDFGSSVGLRNEVDEETYWGTRLYNAPEVVGPSESQSGARIPARMMWSCDVFSYGLLIWEILMDGRCYLDAELSRVMRNRGFIALHDVGLKRLDASVYSSDKRFSVLRLALGLCLNLDATKRPTMQVVLRRLSFNEDTR